MSKVREQAIEDAVCEWAEARGWLVRKITYPGRRGAPDRHFYKGGRLVPVEFKRPGERPDGLQEKEHKRLRAAGFTVHVVTSFEQGVALLETAGA